MKRLLALGGLAVLVAVGLVAGLAASDVAAGGKIEGPNGEHQVVVCKYVGKPGVDERLQTGNNPIVVDANALENDGFAGVFPWEFADAQGQSIAIRWAADSHDGVISECPAPRGPIEVTATAPTFHDPTCEAGASVDLPTVTGVEYAITGTVAAGHEVTVKATALTGYVLVGVTEWEHTFGLVPENCGTAPTEVTATAPSFLDPTCDISAAVHLPTVTGVTYAVTGTVAPGEEVTVKATATEGYVLVGASEWKHTFGQVPDNCTPPPTETTSTPPAETTPTPPATTPATTSATVPTAPLTPPTTTTKPAKPATKPKVKPAAKPAPPKQAVAGAVAQEPPKLAYTP